MLEILNTAAARDGRLRHGGAEGHHGEVDRRQPLNPRDALDIGPLVQPKEPRGDHRHSRSDSVPGAGTAAASGAVCDARYRKPTRVVAMPEGQRLSVPAGFNVNVFADQLQFLAS